MTARVCHSETRSLVPRTEIGFVGGPLGRMTDIARPRTRVAPVRGIRGALVVAAAGFVGWACTGRLSGLLGAARRGAGNGVADGGVGVAWGPSGFTMSRLHLVSSLLSAQPLWGMRRTGRTPFAMCRGPGCRMDG